MNGPASRYLQVHKHVEELIVALGENDQATIAYLIARAALLHVRGSRGAERAAEIAYKLGDEFAAEGVRP